MNLDTAFSGTIAGDFLFACLALAGVKVASAVIQARLMRGDYRNTPDTILFRTIYLTGKITPTLASFCGFVSAYLLHDRLHAWFFGGFTVFGALLALYVVALRKQGRFFGVANLLSSEKRR